MAENIIETNKLTKRFGNFVAVDGLDIKVREGTVHGFIGPNGAGKTTTMKMLVGAIRPSGGSGTIGGHPMGSLEARKLIGFSPEHPRFYENMKALEYLVFIGKVSGMGSGRARERAGELLRWLDLWDSSDKRIGGFSAGMRQKLSLAQAMIHEPRLLILDEPTANLDPAGRLNTIKKLKQLCTEKKMSVFISSHILSELEKIVDDVTIISRGRVVTESGIKSLEAKYAGNEYLLKASDVAKVLASLRKKGYVHKAWADEGGTIHIVSAGDETAFKRGVARAVAESNAALEAFGMATSDLEQVFMKLVGESEQKMEKERRGGRFRINLFGKKSGGER
jgi:ABC-2 type transport system ATP-binding protein